MTTLIYTDPLAKICECCREIQQSKFYYKENNERYRVIINNKENNRTIFNCLSYKAYQKEVIFIMEDLQINRVPEENIKTIRIQLFTLPQLKKE